MKVSSGRLKNKKIYSVEKKKLKPTSLKVRQALFNIFLHRFSWHDWANKSYLLEPYAGTGSISIEALSLGILGCFLVEQDREIFLNLNNNFKRLNLNDKVLLSNQDFFSIRKFNNNFKVVFLDPPFNKDLLNLSLEKVMDEKILSKNAIIVCESEKNYKFKKIIANKLVFSKIYGRLKLTFFII